MIVMDIERLDLQTSKIERFNPKTNKVEIDYVYDAEHLATDWEISDSLKFDNILVSSYENYQYKRTIIFSENLDTNIRYYGRARALLTTGYTEWGNVHIFTMRNDSNLKPQDVFPTRVGTPIIKTYRMNLDTTIDDIKADNPTTPIINSNPWDPNGSKGNDQQFAKPGEVIELLEYIDPNNHDLALFEIWADGFEIIGNAKHIATSWWIEDTNGDVIWKSLDDTFNLRKVQVKNILLRKDRVYRIRCMFHTTSNDASQIGSYTIATKSSSYGILSSYLDLVNPALDTELLVEFEQGINTVTWEVISFEYGLLSPVWSNTTNSIVSYIPKNTLKYNVNYLLRIKTNLSKSWNYYPFITSTDPGETLDSNMTPAIVYPTEFVLAPKDNASIFINIGKNVKFTYELSDKEIIKFNSVGSVITGVSPGHCTIFLRFKQDGYAERIVRVEVEVLDMEGSTNNTGGYMKVLPNQHEMKNDTLAEFSVNTNCNKWIVDHDETLGIVNIISGKTFTYHPKIIGNHKLIVVGYSTDSAVLASEPVNVTVIVNDKPVDPDIPPQPVEYTFNVDVTQLDLVPGTPQEINIITNCDYWDIIMNTNPDVIDVDLQVDLKKVIVTPKKVGEGSIILAGSNGIADDIGQVKIPYRVNYRIGTTTFEFAKREYTVNMNNELTIPYTTNCESVDELNTTITGNNITIVRQTLTEIIILPENDSDDQNAVIDIVAKRTTTSTDSYTSAEDSCRVTIPKVLIPKSDVIRIPDTVKTYNDGLYGVDTFQPKNPLRLAIHVHKDITTTEGMVITGVPYSNQTGTVKELELGPELTEDDGSIKFRLLYIDIATNKDESQPYGPGDTNSYIVNIKIPFDGVIYKDSFSTSPVDVTSLTISDNEDYYFANVGDTKEILINSNTKDITYTVKNPNVVRVTKSGSDGQFTLSLECLSIANGTEISISGANESGFTKTIKVSVYVGQLYEEIGVRSALANWEVDSWISRKTDSSLDENGDVIPGIDISNYYLDNDPINIFPPIRALNWSDSEWTTWAESQVNRWSGKEIELAELAKRTIVTRPIVGTTLKTDTVYQLVNDDSKILRINGISKFTHNNDIETTMYLYTLTGPNPTINVTENNMDGSTNDQFTISISNPTLVTNINNEPGVDASKLVDPVFNTIYKTEITFKIKDETVKLDNANYDIKVKADISNKVNGSSVLYKEEVTHTISIDFEELTYRAIGYRDMLNWTADHWSLFKPNFPKLDTVSDTDSINEINFPMFASVLNTPMEGDVNLGTEEIPLYTNDRFDLIPPLLALNWNENQWSTWVTDHVDKYYKMLAALEDSANSITIQEYNRKLEDYSYLIHTGGKYGLMSRYTSIHTNNNYTVDSVTTGNHMIGCSIKLSSIQISSLNVDDEIVLGRLALYGGNSNTDRFYPIMCKNVGNNVYHVILAPYTTYDLPDEYNLYVPSMIGKTPYDFDTYKENYPMSWNWFITNKTVDDYPDPSDARDMLDPNYAGDTFDLAVVLDDGTVTPIDVMSVTAEQILTLAPEAYLYNGTVDVFRNIYYYNINEYGEYIPDGTVIPMENSFDIDGTDLSTVLENGNMRDLLVYPIRPEEVLMVIDFGSYTVDNPLGFISVANVSDNSNITTLTCVDGNRNISIGITSANMVTRIELDNGNSQTNNPIKFEVSTNKSSLVTDYYTNHHLDMSSTTGLTRAKLYLGVSQNDVPNPLLNKLDLIDKDNINSLVY